MIRQDCIPANLIDVLTSIGHANVVSITTVKSSMRHLVCALSETEYDNRPESFIIMFEGTEEQEAENTKWIESRRKRRNEN